ncbi:hypothetical protein JCM10212_004549 [Sporobolomyces blumeae]
MRDPQPSAPSARFSPALGSRSREATHDPARIARFDGGSPYLDDDDVMRFADSPPSSSPSTPSSLAYTAVFPSSSSSNAFSRPTPSVLPTILPIPVPSSPNPPAYALKSPAGLRVEASPTSPIRTAPRSTFATVVVAVVPRILLPRSIRDPQPFQYPKSPSLLRAHPATRHARTNSSGRTGPTWFSVGLPRRWSVMIAFVLICVVTYSIMPQSTDVRDGWSEAAWKSVRKGWTSRTNGSQVYDAATDAGSVTLVEMRANHHSKPSAVHHDVPGSPGAGSEPVKAVAVDEKVEMEEEQSVLNAVVEEAKQEEQGATDKGDVAAAAPKETIQKVVKAGSDKAQKDSGEAAPAPKRKKDPSRYKRLLPLNAPSRRYLYGANFVASASDADRDDEGDQTVVDDPEYTNKKVKVPSKKTLARLFKENKRTYEEEEEGWRNFEWTAPAADPSLDKLVSKLDADDLALRDWVRRLHSLPSASGVGLGASSPSETMASSPSTSLALAAAVPGFKRGNLDKYAQLVVEAKQGFEGKCQSSTWLDSYQKMHAEMLSGKREPKFISYHCEKGMNCGGLGDRLLGMTSAFFFGLVTQRSFLGEWQSPIPLDVVFDSPRVNWSYSSFTSPRHPVLGQASLVDASAELDIIHFDRLAVDSTFGSTSWNARRGKQWTPGFEKRDIAYASPWIKFFTNRGMIHRSFAYKHLQKSLHRLGLAPATAFACINQYLFRPKPPALNLIAEYTSVLALPSVFSVGIHVRTGDRSMKDSEYDKTNTVKRHSQFFRCARELGETYAHPSQQVVYYLVTDSANLKQDARSVLGSKLVTTDMVPQHVHQKSGHVDGVFSAVVEDWILAKTDMLVATQDSGFGKLASFMHAKENTTVTIFPRYNEDVNGLVSKKSHLKVDCTSPDVFTSFEELSSEWSLG